MSNKDTFVIVSSPSLDSGSDISKDLMKILADAPDGEMESQLLDIPDDWRPPSHPFARVFYTQLCLVTLGKPDLEELWKDVSHEAGWYKVMGIQFWKGLNLEGSWHPFVVVYKEILQRACIFPCYFVYLTCKWILSASVSAADHSSDENYRTLMAISSTLIVLATCGRIFFTTTTMMMVEEKIWANKPRKTAILTCLAVSRMAEISVAFSWAFLASCTCISFVCMRVCTYLFDILFSWAWSFAGDEFGELLDVSCGALHACTIFGRFIQEERKGDDPEGWVGFYSVVWCHLGLLATKLGSWLLSIRLNLQHIIFLSPSSTASY
ncbi:hypothetical protein BD769DRAFT_909907 [Suillus cothurnatus]|nr:hypothetical protein BD769DRAFT_909907 [Suillus cothurnatus]